MTNFKTNLNVYPYNDDYNIDDLYYKYLFKPGVAVQTRELNGLQSALHAQIGVFGDNVYKRGTILSGVNFTFHKPYKYVKLLDNQPNGAIVTPGDLVGKFAVNENNTLKAFVINATDGYESSTPDLKTIYLKYTNSGNTVAANGNLTDFSPANVLKFVDGRYPIDDVDIVLGGAGLSNSDVVVFVSQMLVNVTSGSFSNGDDFHQTDTDANGIITAIDTTTYPGKLLVTVKPKDAHLTNNEVTSAAWTFDRYASVQNIGATGTGTIEFLYGTGVAANVITNSTGIITNIQMDEGGSGYIHAPYVTIKTTNTSVSISGIDLTAKNYVAQATVSAVGNGYAFSVSNGWIYDLGLFLKVEKQTILVSKYSDTPNNIAVGFTVQEEIIDSNIDQNLLDNIITQNESAPGADRLKLTPLLTLQDKEIAVTNNEFLTLVEWNDGKPYKQNQQTQFSAVGEAMAQQAYDQSGNFVMDAFQVTTESPENGNIDSTHFTLTVDPGQAYINGRKVQTLSNYKVNLNKGLDTAIGNNTISLNYGNYVRVNEIGGGFDSANGVAVSLRSQPTQYISNTTQYTGGTITAYGREVGTARIRAFTHESGQPGDANAIYRAYLFNVTLNPGENFDDVRALYYDDATYDAIADCVLEYSPQRAENVAVLKDVSKNALLFSTGISSLKNSNTSTYIYRTTDVVNTTVATAQTNIDLSAGSEYLPYGTNTSLSLAQMRELVVVPTEHDWLFDTNFTGTVDCNTSNTLVTGTGTNFFSDFEIGDYFWYIDGGSTEARQIVNIMSATTLRVDSPFSSTNSAANFRRVFPQNIPVPFGYREGLTANVDATGQILTLDVYHSNGSAVGFDATNSAIDTRVSYNVERRNTQSTLKSVTRGTYVKINLANNVGGADGPWCLGVPDISRLRAVYVGTNTNVTTTDPDLRFQFYVDHNQNSNFLNHGFLYKEPTSGYPLTANNWLLVCFDYFTRDDVGYYDARSYRRTANAAEIATLDNTTFDGLSNTIAAISQEIPEVFTSGGKYYDLINQFDFRPAVDATATPNANAAAAPINPAETIAFTGLQKFPAPDALMSTQIEHYLGRVDDVYIGETGNIFVLKGIPDINPRRRLQSNHPKDSLRLQMINVPPYPNFVLNQGHSGYEKTGTRVANEKYMQWRYKSRLIEPIISTRNLQTSQPMVYTMEDIGNLERRIADLEYYVSLSVLETSLSSRVIPSSLDGTLNRFKYGFFADDYSTDNYSDLNNPQYAATIEAEGDLAFGSALNPMEPKIPIPDDTDIPNNPYIVQPTGIIQKETNRAVPLKHIWGIRHIIENPLFIDYEIISQENATDHSDACVKLVANTDALGEGYFTSIKGKKQVAIYLEGLSGTHTLYFDFILNYDYLKSLYGYIYGMKADILDPNGQIIATTNSIANSVQTLTTEDKIFIETSPEATTFYNGIYQSNTSNNYVRNPPGGDDDPQYGLGIGKLTFTTSQSGYYILQTEHRNAQAGATKFLLRYPTYLSYDEVIVNDPDCDTGPPNYTGTLVAGSLTVEQWSCSNWFRINDTNYRAFILTAFGLKPDTVHKLYIDTTEWLWTYAYQTADLEAAYDTNTEGWYTSRTSVSSQYWDASSYQDGDLLLFSFSEKINELSRFLKQGRENIVNEDGTFSDRTIIRSNAQGKARFMVYFPLHIAAWFSQDFNAEAYAEVPWKNVSQNWINHWVGSGQSNDPNSAYAGERYFGKIKPTGGSSGYSAIHLKNDEGDSIASRLFANRTPFKNIPYDPKGSI